MLGLLSAGAVGAVAVGAGAVGASGLLAACGGGSHPAQPGTSGSPLYRSSGRATPTTATALRGRFESTYRRTTVDYVVTLPPGHAAPDGLPVVIGLHGKGGNQDSIVDFGLAAKLTAAVRAGARPFGFVTVDGGEGSYYHRRTDGTDAGAMVMKELVPLLHRSGFDTTRLGFNGFSMGGYGSLLLAAQYAPAVRAVAVSSPALWLRAGDTAPGAFDSAEDYRTHDVFSRVAVLQRIPLRIDCGLSDPFASSTRVFRSRCHPTPAGGFSKGEHNSEFFGGRLLDQLTFLAAHLG